MSAYSVDGDSLINVYGIDGELLIHWYDVNGNKVSPSYDNYTITTAWSYARYAQGLDVHGDVVAIWDDHQNSLFLKDISDGTLISTLTPGVSSHGNDISFTNEYFDSSDEFPLICVNSQYFFRITRSSITLVRNLTQPNGVGDVNLRYGGVFNGNYMYMMGYRYNYDVETDNFIRIAKVDMTNLINYGDGTYTPTLVSYVDRDWLPCIQGASYHDGMIWIACGLSSPGYLYALDPSTGDIKVSINLGSTGELEGLGWGRNDTDGWFAFIGAVKKGYIKVTFS